MINKKTIATFLAMFAVLILVVLGGLFLVKWTSNRTDQSSAGNYETYSRHFAMITTGEDEGFWSQVYEGALEAGKNDRAYVERFGNNLSVDYDRNQLLQIAISASVDGIIVAGDEEEDTVALIDQAVDQGIPVVTVFQDSTGSRRQCYVGINSYNIGQEYGQQIEKLLTSMVEVRPDGTTVIQSVAGNRMETSLGETSDDAVKRVMVLVDESRLDTSQNLILLGIRETLEKDLGEDYPVIVETRPVDNTRNFSSEESIRDIFLNEADLPDILICLNAVYTTCAYQAAVDYNKVGEVQVLGYYDSDVILEAVSKNIIAATIALDTKEMGAACVEALNEYIDTGYTNGYMAVQTRWIGPEDAEEILAEEPEG